MSWHSYDLSRSVALQVDNFDALIMAAARQADSTNFETLREAFPTQVAELQLRYDSPGGFLPGEQPGVTS
jgi:hypothetical protein